MKSFFTVAGALVLSGLVSAFQSTPMGSERLEPEFRSFAIGPVEGLTTSWHAAPQTTDIPVGLAPLQFYMPAPHGAPVVWTGADEVYRSPTGSFAMCPPAAPGTTAVTVEVLGPSGLTADYRSCVLNCVDYPVEQIQYSSLAVSASPVVVDTTVSQDEINQQTMAFYFGGSIASLQTLAPDHYLTSVRRVLDFTVTVDPPGFAPLAEWWFDGATTFDGVGSDVSHILAENASQTHFVTAGPPATAPDSVLIDTYNVTITSHQSGIDYIPEGESITFTAITEPPGLESYVTWISSTKFGSGDPILGQGPTFTVQFDDTWGAHPDGFLQQWLGVRADCVVFNQDQKDCCCGCVALLGVAGPNEIMVASGEKFDLLCDLINNEPQVLTYCWYIDQENLVGNPIVVYCPTGVDTGCFTFDKCAAEPTTIHLEVIGNVGDSVRLTLVMEEEGTGVPYCSDTETITIE